MRRQPRRRKLGHAACIRTRRACDDSDWHGFGQVAFLYRGRYLSLAQRVSGLQMAHEQPNAPREVSFEYLNQQLVWGELQNFVVFLLPLLTPRAIASTPLLSSALAAFSKLRRWQGTTVLVAQHPRSPPARYHQLLQHRLTHHA